MNTPSQSLATLRPDISGSLTEFDLQARLAKFVGLLIAPVLEVDVQFGNFGRIPLEQLLKRNSDARASGERYNQGSGKFEPDTFATADHGIEEPVDDRESKMYADYFDSEIIGAMRCRNVVLQNLEIDIVTAALAAPATSAPTYPWSDVVNATPVDDITTGCDTFYLASGTRPNCLGLSWRRFNKLKDNKQIIDRIKFAGILDPSRQSITAAALAQLFDLEEVIVAEAPISATNQGAAEVAGTLTVDSLWDPTKALLFRRPNTIDPREPALLRTIHWGEDGSVIGGLIETYRDESRRSNMVRCRMDRQVKTMYTKAGLVIPGV